MWSLFGPTPRPSMISTVIERETTSREARSLAVGAYLYTQAACAHARKRAGLQARRRVSGPARPRSLPTRGLLASELTRAPLHEAPRGQACPGLVIVQCPGLEIV